MIEQETSSPTSNIMTHNEMVILQTPAKKATAPTIAKIPGEMVVIHCPMSRPKKAPASSAGMITPEGTLHPKVMVVSRSFDTVPYTSHPTYLVLAGSASCWHYMTSGSALLLVEKDHKYEACSLSKYCRVVSEKT